jgi:hypothetical protein
MHRRTTTEDKISGPPLARGLFLQSVRVDGVTFNHDLTTSFKSKKRKFAVYSIRIHSYQSIGPRTVQHRFSSFCTLHRNLVKLGKSHSYLLKGLKFPTKFTIGHSTSKKIVNIRTIKLNKYLTTILKRLPTKREAAAHDPACVLMRQFLLIRSRVDDTLYLQTATEAMSAQLANTGGENTTNWKNPLESEQVYNKKCLALTGQTATAYLNEYLLKIVQNDPRKNGLTSQIRKFIDEVKVEHGKGSVRADLERVLSRSSLVSSESKDDEGSRGFDSGKSNGIGVGRRSARKRSNLSISDARALDKAIENQEKSSKRRKMTLNEITNAIEAKLYESRLRRVNHFAENLYDLLLEDHLLILMNMLPVTKEQILRKRHDLNNSKNKVETTKTEDVSLVIKDVDGERGDEDSGEGEEGEENSGNQSDAEEEVFDFDDDDEPVDPREELVKHIVQDAVELAIYHPLYDILKFYSTKLKNTIDLDMKIITCIVELKEKYCEKESNHSNSQLPQSIFHLNFKSPSHWEDSIFKLGKVKTMKSPTHMLLQILATVHCIHSTYYAEYKKLKRLRNDMSEPPPLGADDFLPIFVYVTACANLPHPQTTFQMIAQLSNKDRLEGLAKYFLTVFESALWFLSSGSENFQMENEDGKGVEVEKGKVLETRNSSSSSPKCNAKDKDEKTTDSMQQEDHGDSITVASMLDTLELRMIRMSGRLVGIERMLELNAMSLSSNERRGSCHYKTSLAPITQGRQGRTMSEEVAELGLTV